MAAKTLIIIPARMASTRLFGKPLADIHGKAMILHVAERAREANIGPVIIATDHRDIAQVANKHGFDTVMTNDSHESGSDRIYEALTLCDRDGSFDRIVNLQGDLPTISSQDISAALRPLNENGVDIATLGAEIRDPQERCNPNIVKIVGSPLSTSRLRALYFTRAPAPYGEGPLYHHIGLYIYRREALERFVKFAPSVLEKREKLEQLRALENNMRIDVEIIMTVPLGVDTQDDLEKARFLLAKQS